MGHRINGTKLEEVSANTEEGKERITVRLTTTREAFLL